MKKTVFAFAAFLCVVGTTINAQEIATIELSIKNHKFEPAEIKIPANKPVILKVKNLDSTPEEIESKSLKIEKVIAGGSEATLNIRPLTAGIYKFVGEFNEKTAQGQIVVE